MIAIKNLRAHSEVSIKIEGHFGCFIDLIDGICVLAYHHDTHADSI